MANFILQQRLHTRETISVVMFVTAISYRCSILPTELSNCENEFMDLSTKLMRGGGGGGNLATVERLLS